MTFGEAISDGFSKYATFSGRTSRSGYWWFYLFYILVLVGASILDAAIKTPILTGLAVLALSPTLAVLVRRLHDTDHSGWWILISFVPLVGTIVLIVFACIDSGPPNKYGDGPDGKDGLTVTSPLGQTLPPPPPPAQSPPPSEMPPPQQPQATEPPAGDPPPPGPTA